MSAGDFIAALRPAANKPIRLHVNSPGGSVFDAVAIYNALKNHPRKVTASIEGLAASAAGVVVMAAAEIRATGNSFLMIHNPSALCVGDAGAMREMADFLDRVKTPLIAAYRRCRTSDAEIAALMARETWYSAQ